MKLLQLSLPHLNHRFFNCIRLSSLFITLALGLVLSACDKQTTPQARVAPNAATANPPSSPSPIPSYISTGDFGPIQLHGRLRFIAARGATDIESLSDHSPVFKEYYKLAEAFAKHHQLQTEWIYVDDKNELIPALLAGRGDIIVGNISVTESRKQHVAFSRALTHVDEVIIEHKAAAPAPRFYVSKNSAFVKTLTDKNLENVELVDSKLSNYDRLSWLEESPARATVMDSNTAKSLIGFFPKLKIGQTLKKNRLIAWAVRPENPDLLTYLNHFLVEHYIAASTDNAEKLNWQAIKERGELRMLTLNNPASYFLWKGEQMGFDYELLKMFAKENNLRLSVIVKKDINALIEALKNGEADVIAASMTIDKKRQQRGIQFSHPYLYVNELIVTNNKGPTINSIEQLAGLKVAVNPSTVFYQRLLDIKQQGIDIDIVKREHTNTDMLLQELELGKADFTIADSHLVALESTYHQHIKEQLILSKNNPIAWALRPEQNELKKQLNSFIKRRYKGLRYNLNYNKHFKNERQILKYQEARVRPGEKLSPYDELTKANAYQYNMDWRLVTSQMYQESRFKPQARSSAGAQGLMQVLPRTAKEFGFQNLTDPDTGIKAGLSYMDWLKHRFPSNLDFEERLYFSLASYNAGPGHVRDARRLAKQLGYDNQRWFANVEKAMLLLSEPEYYQNAHFGYVRGQEPVNYVREIRNRYLAYLNTH